MRKCVLHAVYTRESQVSSASWIDAVHLLKLFTFWGGEMSELAEKLAHRNAVNEGMAEKKMRKVSNVYMEFQEFTRKQINDYEKIFNTYVMQVVNNLEIWLGRVCQQIVSSQRNLNHDVCLFIPIWLKTGERAFLTKSWVYLVGNALPFIQPFCWIVCCYLSNKPLLLFVVWSDRSQTKR